MQNFLRFLSERNRISTKSKFVPPICVILSVVKDLAIGSGKVLARDCFTAT